MHKILQSYLRRLTNLSGNNRSLYLPRLAAGQFVDVHDFDFLNNFPSFKIIEWLIAEGAHDLKGISGNYMPLCPIHDSRYAGSNKVSNQLKKLSRKEKFLHEEQGSKDLYIGWPFVRGKFSDGTIVRCPLMFFPVNLEYYSNAFGQQWALTIRKEVNIALNKSFLLAYAYYNGQQFDEVLSERSFDDFSTDSRIFRNALYELFKESAVNLHFNQELFIDKLQSFREFTKPELEGEEKDGLLKLYPEAVLGIFPQAGSYLVPDYLRLMKSNQIPDVEAFFGKRASSEQQMLDNLVSLDKSLANLPNLQYASYASRVKEEHIFTPFAMDAYQEKALRLVKRGNSIVVQGPPGTGKSQLIANLIADHIAHGKKVLLVSQKKAALDVVYTRLKEKDMHPFVALVHDFKNDRKAIFQQISSQVDSLHEYELKNNNLDTIYLERNFLQSSRRIEQICEELDEFKFALFDESEAGVSVKELYLTSSLHEPYLHVKQEYQYFKISDNRPFIDKLRRFTAYALRYNKESYLLSDRKPFIKYTIEDLKSMRELVAEIPSFKQGIAREVSRILKADTDYITCENLQYHTDEMLSMVKLLKEPEAYENFQYMVSLLEKGADPLWLSNMERVVLECFRGEGPEVTLETEELGKFQQLLQETEEARAGFFKWLWWKLFSREKEKIKKVLAANHAKPDKKGLSLLSEKMDNRLNLEHNLSKLKEHAWLRDVPAKNTSDGYSKAMIQNWIFHQKQALSAALIFRSLRNFNEFFNVRKISYEQLSHRVGRLVEVLHEIPVKQKVWSEYFTPAQISKINTQEHSDRYIKVLDKDFDALCDFDTLKANVTEHEHDMMFRLYEYEEDASEDSVERLFQNSVRLAWIDHIEQKYPVLRIVSSLRIKELEEELQRCIAEKSAISKQILLMKAREKTYYDVEYNRLSNMVTYRDLYHQVNKKRKIWPLRKLINTFQDELFSLIPCWMASPESVSAVFPIEDMPVFDLVVFDEASQCFAEKGIPAMYRGQQVVIAGDSRQLAPNDLYQARWEDEEESENVEEALAMEAASLLDLASGYLMTVQLRGHYRSKSYDLIDFSNQHFYGGKLQMLPDFQDIGKDEPAIHYVKVDGMWKNNINIEESEKVVELVEEILQREPGKNIGVITFNARQQEKILDDLEQSAIGKQYPLPDALFVKNIENVQGDERDIIIFSMAYAPNEKGRMMMQFGSLNTEKGENRLNVAITRAKERIYLVSSILPEQLEVANTRNEGPKLLKKYLHYALQVSERKYIPEISPLDHHDNAWFLQNRIRSWVDQNFSDFQVQRDLPFADLSVKVRSGRSKDYLGLINTDDELYFQSESAKDMHAYRHFTLREKNWKFKFVYSRQYWQNQELLKEDLIRFLKT